MQSTGSIVFYFSMTENQKRQHSIQHQQVIFGPVSFHEHNYFEYAFSNIVLELQKKLVQEGILSNNNNLIQLNQEYEQWIDEQLSLAEIVINDSQYHRAGMQ